MFFPRKLTLRLAVSHEKVMKNASISKVHPIPKSGFPIVLIRSLHHIHCEESTGSLGLLGLRLEMLHTKKSLVSRCFEFSVCLKKIK